MYKWQSVQTKTELEFILDNLLKEIKDLKITKIFSLNDTYPNKKNDGNIGFVIEDELFIELENSKCLVIMLRGLNNASIEYRELSDDEKEKLTSLKHQDLFHSHYEIRSSRMNEEGTHPVRDENPRIVKNINLDYDVIDSFEVIGFNHSYEKAISNYGVVQIPEGGDYFEQINIKIKNGSTICISNEAYIDDHINLWIQDMKEYLDEETK